MRNVARAASLLPLAGLCFALGPGCAVGDAGRPATAGGLAGATPDVERDAAASALAAEPPADPSTLAVPGPAAAPCTSDAMCLNHRCNVAYAKCAFPCASDADCVRGTSCFKAVISTCQSSPPNVPAH